MITYIVMVQRILSTVLHFQVERVTLNILDCKDCLTITFILLLPSKMQQVLTYIRCFKREHLATIFPSRRLAWRGGQVRAELKGVWKLQDSLAGPRSSRGNGLWVCTSCSCLLLTQTGWASLQAAPGSASL